MAIATTVPVQAASTREPVVLSPGAVRRIAVSVVLIAAAFSQAPGRTVADTKLDLTQDPWRFLGRALHLWDPTGASGQLQNQAYGYLWPVGPFFGIAHSLGLSAWVTQRLWWSLLLLLAFHGLDRLAKAMGIGTPTSRLVAAAAYALAPRIVSELGAVSAEAWPMALTPWVLLPLVRGSREGSERRAAGLSGLALLCVGGVNAAATGVTLILPVWWLVARAPGPRLRRLWLWWVAAVIGATFWWLIPLALLGGYSPPFLDWIESAAVTTSVASPINALRGVTQWVAYLPGAWPAGSSLVTSPLLILQSGLLAALGVAGLCWRRLPERTFLVGAALGGILLLTIWHTGAADSPLAPTLQTALDQGLAPLRNVHKFDPVLRVPLALGLAHLLGSARIRPLRDLPITRYAIQAVAVLAVLSMGVPFLANRVAPPGSFTQIPGYWTDAADWLHEHASGRTLVLPGAPHSTSYWGVTSDEPMQVVARGDWAVRDAVPLSSAGNIRLLDSIEQQLASGTGGAGLAELLADAGISDVLVRHDIVWARTGSTRPTVVDAALQSAPGLRRAKTFGPLLGFGTGGQVTIDQGLDLEQPALVVYAVTPPAVLATRWDVSRIPRVAGGPEDLLRLRTSGLLPAGPTVLQADAPTALRGSADLVTDGYRRREMAFGRIGDDSSSQTLAADDPYVAPRPVHDYWPVPPDGSQTVVRYTGITGVTASSSGASGLAAVQRSRGHAPWSALDGDQQTSWWTGGFGHAVGQWIEVRLPHPVTAAGLRLRLAAGSARVLQVRVDVSGGQRSGTRLAAVRPGSHALQRLPIDGGLSGSTLRITVTKVRAGDELKPVGLSDLVIPAVFPTRTYVVPGAAASDATLVFGVSPDSHTACLFFGHRPLCSPALARPGEEDRALDRTFTVSGTWRGTAQLRAVPRPGPVVNRLLRPLGDSIVVSASSSEMPDPAARPQAAADADLGSAWLAGTSDTTPTLTLRWQHGRTVAGLQLLSDAALAASRATRVRVTFGDGTSVTAPVGADGRVRFPAVTTTMLRLTVLATDRRRTVDPVTSYASVLPFGVSEVSVDGADDLRRPVDAGAPTALPCGFGPPVTLDGREIPTRVDGTLGDLLEHRPMPVTLCTGQDLTALVLSAGTHRIAMTRSLGAEPWTVTLLPETAATRSAESESLQVMSWTGTHRVLDVDAAAQPTVVRVAENANRGWHADLGGHDLKAIRLDGWQQGYLVPAGLHGQLVLTYGPDRGYRLGLMLGLGLALLVLMLALWPANRTRRRPPLRPWVPGPRWALGVGAAWLIVLAGWLGLVVALAALAAVALRLPRSLLAQVAGGLAFIAVLLVAWRPFPGSDALDLAAAPQGLVLASLAVVVVVLAAELAATGRRRSPPAAEPPAEAAGSGAPPPAS